MHIEEGKTYFGKDLVKTRRVYAIDDQIVYYAYPVKFGEKYGHCNLETFKNWAKCEWFSRYFKEMSELEWLDIRNEIKMMLHAHRDCLRNQRVDTRKTRMDARDGYYGEAFGVIRALAVLDYGYLGSGNLDGQQEHSTGPRPTRKDPDYVEPRHNLNWWFNQVENEVLEEEGYYDGSYYCPRCERKYGKGKY